MPTPQPHDPLHQKQQRRFDRQFDRVERHAPRALARLLHWLRRPTARLIRIPLGLLLICGGLLGFLPVLGLWMLPLGLLLLAIDLPLLQGPVAVGLIRFGRWLEGLRMRVHKGGKR